MLFHLGQIAASESSDDVEIVVVTHSRFIMALEKTADSMFSRLRLNFCRWFPDAD